MTILVDSDIIIEVTRARNEQILARWYGLVQGSQPILYSPVSAAELWAGAWVNEHARLTNLFNALICVPVDYSIGKRAGEYLQRYSPSHAIDFPDAVVAATAVSSGAALWTNNRKHYPMPELTLV
ncbi:MAG: type II toxin-antitoxin system VapC family toxin [Rhodospirillales bacterium]|nr:type II toxin-antitoxin system VapC family toxin [Acetobacter sp.]